MDELEGKLNALFSSPESMERIMQLARSLSGNAGSGEDSSQKEDSGSSSSDDSGSREDSEGGLGSILGGLSDLDPRVLQIAMGAMQEFSKPSETAVLINAIKPYLSSDRVSKVERALSIARIAKIARKVIPEFGGK